MRISDWSSDVCSSDLLRPARVRKRAAWIRLTVGGAALPRYLVYFGYRYARPRATIFLPRYFLPNAASASMNHPALELSQREQRGNIARLTIAQALAGANSVVVYATGADRKSTHM